MITFDYFPGGKHNCVTFSYDDGHQNDVRLIELFNKYGLKATFNLTGGIFKRITQQEIREIYKEHEIACHGEEHISLNTAGKATIINEIFMLRKKLEGCTDYPVTGMAYANGVFDDSAVEMLDACGIEYSRTAGKRSRFIMPDDFLRWDPTCHHREGLAYAEQFKTAMEGYFSGPRLFYIWGHSSELRTEENWEYMERLCAAVAGDDRVWYATNMEIFRYTQALRRLVIAADESFAYNPTAIDLWVAHNRQPVKIPAGETVRF